MSLYENNSDLLPQTAIQDSLQSLRDMLDAVPALVSYVGADDRFRFVSKRYEDWFEVTRDEIIGRRVRDVIGEANYAKCGPHIAAALRGEPQDYNDFIGTACGRRRWLRGQFIPQSDATGRIVGFIAQVEDITSLKDTECALREQEALLAQATAMA